MKLTIPGNPIPKMRPRFARQGNFVKTYDVQGKEIKYVQNCVIRQIRELINHPDKKISLEASEMAHSSIFVVEMRFYMPIPRHCKNKALNEKLWNFEFHNHKPDVSNLIKFYEDCLNGILFHDDSQIVEIRARKLYSDNPRTEIIIMPKKEMSYNDTRRILTCLSPKDVYCISVDCRELESALAKFNDQSPEDDLNFIAKNLYAFSKKYANVINKISKLKLEEV